MLFFVKEKAYKKMNKDLDYFLDFIEHTKYLKL